MELDLVNSRHGLASRVFKKRLEIQDGEVGNSDVLDTTRGWELLHLFPCLVEIPVW